MVGAKYAAALRASGGTTCYRELRMPSDNEAGLRTGLALLDLPAVMGML